MALALPGRHVKILVKPRRVCEIAKLWWDALSQQEAPAPRSRVLRASKESSTVLYVSEDHGRPKSTGPQGRPFEPFLFSQSDHLLTNDGPRWAYLSFRWCFA